MNDINLHGALLAGQFCFILPEIFLAVVACGMFLGGTYRSGRNLWGSISLGGLLGGLGLLALTASWEQPTGHAAQVATFSTPLLFDSLAYLIRALVLGVGILLVLFGWNEIPERQAADSQACLLIIIAGAGLTACANDLVSLFLALELISIPTYIFLYLPRHDDASQEAALKYFLLSIFSSGLFLFGLSYLYGLTGTTNIAAILDMLNQESMQSMPALAAVALIMVVAGLGFRITAAPFHFYAPDVYQGAPTVAAALLASIPKIAGFVALVRLLGFVLPEGVEPRTGLAGRLFGMSLSDQVPILLWFLAAFTMSLGNLLAVLQDNLKRLLAYSSVAHAGYMLVALAAAPYLDDRGGGGSEGVQALLYYLAAYSIMTIGAFAVLGYLATPERPVDNVDDLAGLAGSHPHVALLFTVFLFSLIGIPLTAGFTGKFLIFFGAMNVTGDQAALFRWLAVIGMLNAAVGGWYYLRIIAVMYLRNPLRPFQTGRNLPGLAALILCAVLTIGLSVPPAATWLLWATRSATAVKTLPPDVQAQR